MSDEPNHAPLEVLYEEGPVIAINKRAGILTQAPPGIESLEAEIKAFLIEREQKPGNCYLGVPHRLDRPASGAIIFAKHARAARRLSEQFQGRLIEKKYWALVEGNVEEDEGTWIDYMRKIPGRAEAEILAPIHPEAREAILHYRVLKRISIPNSEIASNTVSWLEIQLETGRTHQIRLQTSSRGFPILGDALYGARLPFGEPFEDERLRAIALHSREISFSHPVSREKVTLTAPVSADWSALGVH